MGIIFQLNIPDGAFPPPLLVRHDAISSLSVVSRSRRRWWRAGPCSWRLIQKGFDFPHDLGDSPHFLQNALDDLLRRKVGDILLGIRVFPIEVAIIGQNFVGRDFPRAIILYFFKNMISLFNP
jgi:hypothetical protein